MVKGELSSILIEGISSQMSARLVLEDGTLYLALSDVRAASDVVWNGLNSNIWDFGQSENFTLAEEARPVFFRDGRQGFVRRYGRTQEREPFRQYRG